MQIAKTVDVAIAAETSGKIEEYQVEYIINAIANYRILPRQELESQSKNTKTNPTHNAENICQTNCFHHPRYRACKTNRRRWLL